MLNLLTCIATKAWKPSVWGLTQSARLIVVALNWTMFPQQKTGRPNPWAIAGWMLINDVLLVRVALLPHAHVQLYVALALALVHFLIVVTALLVITEENDVWAGYVRFDRTGGKDERAFQRGRIVKSLPLIALSAAFYLSFTALAVKAYHSESSILSVAYSVQIPIAHYFATVAAQVPLFDTLLNWTDFKGAMKFQGVIGVGIKLVIYTSNVSIIVGTFNSYFRQKSQLRRLVEALGSETGNIPILQGQASRAPEEIKSAILQMALHDPEAHVRWRAMTVAQFANILTFPTTIVYNLHNETRERNKQHALEVAIQIVKNNYGHLEPDYFEALDRKIEFQLQGQRQRHSRKTLERLVELRRLLQSAK